MRNISGYSLADVLTSAQSLKVIYVIGRKYMFLVRKQICEEIN